ncbi:HAMP domain-containing sensor histidine kinase [Streptomyces sp. NPDC002506]|uniref:sensor histidine kinase n=1 Tax=Streptomyces sp. NPDC002506 TaxID=3154536 RepID=UPI003319AAC6
MRSPFARLSTGARTAVAAGLATLLLAAAGAWWLRQYVYDSRMAAAEGQALVQARVIARDNTANGGISHVVHGDTVGLPYVVLDPHGVPVLMGAPFKSQSAAGHPFTPAPRTAAPSWHNKVKARFQDRAGTARNRLSGNSFTAYGVYSYAGVSPAAPNSDWAPGRYTVYVLVTPFAAEAAVSVLDLPLAVGIPAAALLVAGIAWLSTRRALRPIDAIRSELAVIGENQLDRRVPVPRAKDAIFRMAVTTNVTLDRLERSAQEQHRFVADASHELRSPIAALRTNLEVSLTHPERADWPQATGEALIAVRRLQQLADDLLFLARPAEHDPADDLVDLADLATDTVTELVPVSSLRVTVRAPARAVVRGSTSQLRRLLRNLLDNAARHAAHEITVTVLEGRSGVRLEVRDDGCGIAPADRERIFERFTRLDESRSRDAGGSGLGLAIARDIAHRHGATLHAAHSPPGQGAQFVADFPAGRPASPGAASGVAAHSGS